MSFTHLRVASGYSMRYGADLPHSLVARAGELGLQSLALTDRDGLYGAVKFVSACTEHAITPLLGVDLATHPVFGEAAPVGRTPVRGGRQVDRRLPRVTVLARAASTSRRPGGGWAALCRLVTATHLRGERGEPVADHALIGEHATGESLVVLLGPDSELGLAIRRRRLDLARAVLARWYDALPVGCLVIEVVCHDGPPGSIADLGHAARMLQFADMTGMPAVLSNAVRYADDPRTVDLLDAVRRLVPLSERNIDRTSGRGGLVGSAEMAQRARRVVQAAGGDRARVVKLLADTEKVADGCRLNPAVDLGIGSVHLPEPEVLFDDWDPLRDDADQLLRARCELGLQHRYPGPVKQSVLARMDDELKTIAALGYPTFFLTVAEVCDLTRRIGVRVAARGSGAGSLVNYLLGISGVDPIAHGLQMERFCTILRTELPDIDIDVESARRTEVYEQILNRFGGRRVACVSMMDSYRVRHAVRDVGAALGLTPSEISVIAKAFPHIRAGQARQAIADLPELRRSGLQHEQFGLLFDLVERLDGLPRHIALHPCGVLLSDAGLGERTSLEASWSGFPMSQFDKDDVEELGLLKLDVLGIRMQSAMAYAVQEVQRVDGPHAAQAGGHDPDAGYLDRATGRIDLDVVPLDDEPTYELIRSTRTLGCFQIESPGQRELIGKFGPKEFADLIIDISLFRPGPVKSDMIVPFLSARQGWADPDYLHPRLREPLQQTAGVVVFHEQVIDILAITAGISRAEADEERRRLGSAEGQRQVEQWWRPRAAANGFEPAAVERIWQVLKAFASFGFCKAHAAAFALPTYQSAWLKAHHPAAFLAGVLTHDPGMYPKRLILDDARNLGIAVLGLDVNLSEDGYRVERAESARSGYGIRLSLAEVKGITAEEIASVAAGRPYLSLTDFWHRARVSRPVAERIVLAGGFDSLHGTGSDAVRRGRVTRRDLLLQVAELERWTGRGRKRTTRKETKPLMVEGFDVRAAAAAQSRAAAEAIPAGDRPVQLTLDLLEAEPLATGLAELNPAERVRAELDVFGLDVSCHVLQSYLPMLADLDVVPCRDLLNQRSGSELLIAGVKVATQTPPVRSGRRVVFVTVEDSTGPGDGTLFEDVQGDYAATVFNSWLLVIRGVLRRTGPRGVSLRVTGAWNLPQLWRIWDEAGAHAVREEMARPPQQTAMPETVPAGSRLHSEVRDDGDVHRVEGTPVADRQDRHQAAVRRVLVHASGFRQSPYADVRSGPDPKNSRTAAADTAEHEAGETTGQAGADSAAAPRKLWHSSPGSPGW